MPVVINPTLSLPDESISMRFIRAGGPGGQNVNKVATAVQMRFDPKLCPQLNERVLARLHRIAGRRMTDSGEIVISAQRFRTQEANKHDAHERLAEMLRAALIEPKVRRATKPSRASKERRLQHKQERSAIKSARGRVRGDD